MSYNTLEYIRQRSIYIESRTGYVEKIIFTLEKTFDKGKGSNTWRNTSFTTGGGTTISGKIDLIYVVIPPLYWYWNPRPFPPQKKEVMKFGDPPTIRVDSPLP